MGGRFSVWGPIGLPVMLSIGTDQFKNFLEGASQIDNHFKNSNSKGFFSALGPSSSFPIKHSSYILNKYPYLDDKSFPNIFPDFRVFFKLFCQILQQFEFFSKEKTPIFI